MHQLATSAVYVLMLYPVWIVRAWIPSPWDVIFVLTVLASVAAATTRAAARVVHRAVLPSRPGRAAGATRNLKRWCDLIFASLLLGAAFVIAVAHPEFAMLLVAVATAAVVASLIID